MSLKFTRDLCVVTMKNDAKFEQEKNLRNFGMSAWKSKKFVL